MGKATPEEIKKELLHFVSENIMDKSAVQQLNEQTPFRDIGIDSFSIIQIVLFIERKYKLAIAEKDLVPENLNSIASIADFTHKHL